MIEHISPGILALIAMGAICCVIGAFVLVVLMGGGRRG
jgi:hypothetical protein